MQKISIEMANSRKPLPALMEMKSGMISRHPSNKKAKK